MVLMDCFITPVNIIRAIFKTGNQEQVFFMLYNVPFHAVIILAISVSLTFDLINISWKGNAKS